MCNAQSTHYDEKKVMRVIFDILIVVIETNQIKISTV